MIDLILNNWQWCAVTLVLTVIGNFTSTKLFTRSRAYGKYDSRAEKHFWWWGRETLSLHPIITGGVVGLAWGTPQQVGSTHIDGFWYFASAGAVSLCAWSIIKGFAKSRGYMLPLPGESIRPQEAAHVEQGQSGGKSNR